MCLLVIWPNWKDCYEAFFSGYYFRVNGRPQYNSVYSNILLTNLSSIISGGWVSCCVNCTVLFGGLCSFCLWIKSLLKVLWFLMPELNFILQRNKANQVSCRSNCPVLLTLKYTVYVLIHSYGLNYFLNNKIFFIPPFGAYLSPNFSILSQIVVTSYNPASSVMLVTKWSPLVSLPMTKLCNHTPKGHQNQLSPFRYFSFMRIFSFSEWSKRIQLPNSLIQK